MTESSTWSERHCNSAKNLQKVSTLQWLKRRNFLHYIFLICKPTHHDDHCILHHPLFLLWGNNNNKQQTRQEKNPPVCWCCHYHCTRFPSQVSWPWISSALFLVLQINLCSKETNCEKKKTTTTTRKYWPVRSHTIISFGISKRWAVVDVLLAPFQLVPSQIAQLCCSNTLAYRFLSKRETGRSLGQLLMHKMALTPFTLDTHSTFTKISSWQESNNK